MAYSRRSFLGLSASCCGASLLPIAQISNANNLTADYEVVWGGTGFNVQYDEIGIKLSEVSAALDANNQLGWAAWNEGAFEALSRNFRGQVIGYEEKINSEDDPGLIFSVGFDYENYVQLLVPGSELDEKAKAAGLDKNDITYHYLFSSVRIYSVELPRGSGGKVTLIYSKPVKAANQALVNKDGGNKTPFILETLVGDHGSSTLGKLEAVASEMAVSESFFEPRHAQVRAVGFSDQAIVTFETLKINKIFNSNLFAAITGVSLNQAFGSSVIPYVVSDYLGRTLSSRFSNELQMGKVFDEMDRLELASVLIDVNVAKVIRKISAENASKQQIARGVAIDCTIRDQESKADVLTVKLVRVEKREQIKGVSEDSWYRANDSIAFYELLETMMQSFFVGLKNKDQDVLRQAGVRPSDITADTLDVVNGLLSQTTYGA